MNSSERWSHLRGGTDPETPVEPDGRELARLIAAREEKGHRTHREDCVCQQCQPPLTYTRGAR